ncbi:MAG TPA: hypothetical protein VEB22_00280 [Phycisphaerales bacterium]|nr:hypothetical protein [Phycisphaerales bacterium]
MIHARSTVAAIATLVVATTVSAQVLNGGFENNTAGASMSNLSNAAYSATVADSVAFGPASETDLWDSTGFGSMVPESGNWMIGLHRQSNGNTDAVSLALGTPIVAGQQYTLGFASALHNANFSSTLDIGISGSDSAIGTIILSVSPGSDSSWTLYSYNFFAPANATHLTFSVANVDGYLFVDSVSLVLVPAPSAAAPLVGLGGLVSIRRRR